MFPLFLPQSRNTRDLELRVEYLEKMLAQKTDAPDDIFPAQITSGPTDDAYAWKRRSWDENGDRADHPNGQTGSVDVDPAYDPNNATHSAGTEVWLRKRMATTTSKRIKYEIIAGGGGGDLEVTFGGADVFLTPSGSFPDGADYVNISPGTQFGTLSDLDVQFGDKYLLTVALPIRMTVSGGSTFGRAAAYGIFSVTGGNPTIYGPRSFTAFSAAMANTTGLNQDIQDHKQFTILIETGSFTTTSMNVTVTLTGNSSGATAGLLVGEIGNPTICATYAWMKIRGG